MGRFQREIRCESGRVIHWVGHVSEEVFGVLESACDALDALSDLGALQTVVAFEDEHWPRVPRGYGDTVEFVVVPRSRNPIGNWLHSVIAINKVLRTVSVNAIYIHGQLPSIAVWLLNALSKRSRPQVYYSPRTSKSIYFPELRHAALSSIELPIEILGKPLIDSFLNVTRNRGRYPLVLTSTRRSNPQGAELMARVAVLFSAKSLHIAFNWLGVEDAESARRLRAASVQIFDVKNDLERAKRLAVGWIYLAIDGSHGVPICLVEAMSVGLPCVVLDTPSHRDLIRHGESGFLYRNEDELLSYVAQLVDSPSTCVALGNAARKEAYLRFSPDHFRESFRSTFATVS